MPPRKIRRSPEERAHRIAVRMSAGTVAGTVESASPVREEIGLKAQLGSGEGVGHNHMGTGLNSTVLFGLEDTDESTSGGADGTSGGTGARASNDETTAYGAFALADGVLSTSIGANSYTPSDYASAFGQGANVTQEAGTALGYLATSQGIHSTALGADSSVDDDHVIMLGTSSDTVVFPGGIALGSLSGPGITQSKTLSYAGTSSVGAGTMRWYPPTAITITSVRASVNTQPIGASLIVDVNKNGTTIFTTQSNRPQIAASTNTDLSGTPDVTALAIGDYIQVDIDQVGSTVAGADLTVEIGYTQA